MTRYSVLKEIMDYVSDEVVIVSTGMLCREVYQIRDRDRNFYMMGSMGMALPIGIGLAYARKDIEVIVISGDGAVLMNLGSMVLHNKLTLPNLWHFVIDNNSYNTTGGQITCSDAVDFCSLAPNTNVYKVSSEKGTAPRINMSCREIKERVYASINK